MVQELIDRIYECSFAPDMWPDVLDELSHLAEAQGGVLFASREKVSRWAASPAICEHVENFMRGDWLSNCTRGGKLFSRRHPGFLTDDDVYTAEELERDPNYSEFLRPRGLGYSAATAISLPTGDTGIICLERSHDRGPVEPSVIRQLDELRPHLARAAFLATRLQLERARVAGETFGLIGLPALVLDDDGRVISANDPSNSLNKYVRWRAHDRVSLVDASADGLLRHAMDALDDDLVGAPRSFAARSGEEESPMIANLVPIRGAARDIFVRCAAVLVMTPVGSPQAPASELVQSLYDLTPAEARVARGLVAGKTLEEIATDQSVSRNTVRTHLRGVMEKTGSNRQAEVVALLGGLAPLTSSKGE
ncbi:MAG: helix-turn-helix transcriptional regulator [Alphaproteobacteria bacterium]|nr:helix-turn-helix transcriptional regulator [Alphaproteobacteria bacterium]MBM3641114.1 helix-turn-helix transcriptional regulator [Alphaproteobacteria bacterium]